MVSMKTAATRRRIMRERLHRARRRRRTFVVAVCTIAVMVTVFSFAARRRGPGSRGAGADADLRSIRGGRLRGGGRKKVWVAPEAQPFNEDSAANRADHLIVVAGHSVIVAGNLEDAETDEDVWYLLPYQRGRGLPQAIVSHIRTGISEAGRDPRSLLIFSGGETRGRTGPIGEGGSYFRVADALDLWDEPPRDDGGGGEGASSAVAAAAAAGTGGGGISTVRARTVTEEFATDSFQNLLFSICRFKEVTGSYPRRITVVSFSFKRRRFEEMHSGAIRWPPDRFRYVGVDPPPSTGFDSEEAGAGEEENAARPFEGDPYGCHTPVLQQKRRERNPFARTPPYELTCPEISSLLKWCGPDLHPKNELPWGSA